MISQTLLYHCVIKKILKLDCFLARVWASRHKNVYHRHINAFSFKTVQNKNARFSFKATVDAADKDTFYSICSTPKTSTRKFCDGLEMKFTSSWGGIQQAGTPETGAKSVTPCFHIRQVITSAWYKILFHYHQLPHGA